jgi:hypothetical protein
MLHNCNNTQPSETLQDGCRNVVLILNKLLQEQCSKESGEAYCNGVHNAFVFLCCHHASLLHIRIIFISLFVFITCLSLAAKMSAKN